MHDRGLSTAVGDEGGFAPALYGTEDAIESILQAITKAGYQPGKDVTIALDCASSEFYHDGIFRLGLKITVQEDEPFYLNGLF